MSFGSSCDVGSLGGQKKWSGPSLVRNAAQRWNAPFWPIDNRTFWYPSDSYRAAGPPGTGCPIVDRVTSRPAVQGPAQPDLNIAPSSRPQPSRPTAQPPHSRTTSDRQLSPGSASPRAARHIVAQPSPPLTGRGGPNAPVARIPGRTPCPPPRPRPWPARTARTDDTSGARVSGTRVPRTSSPPPADTKDTRETTKYLRRRDITGSPPTVHQRHQPGSWRAARHSEQSRPRARGSSLVADCRHPGCSHTERDGCGRGRTSAERRSTSCRRSPTRAAPPAKPALVKPRERHRRPARDRERDLQCAYGKRA